MNLLAFPGLGTILARKPGGYLQAMLSALGFLLVMGCLGCCCYSLAQRMLQSSDAFSFSAEWRRYGWAGLSGLGLCALSWVWALVSSIQILQESRG